jgi:hypothetical protein
LWAISSDSYLLIECKNEVELNRAEVAKTESGQLNNSVGWFNKTYPACRSEIWMITPAKRLGKGAEFNFSVRLIGPDEISELSKRIRAFARGLSKFGFGEVSSAEIQLLLASHKLLVEDLLTIGQKKQKE